MKKHQKKLHGIILSAIMLCTLSGFSQLNLATKVLDISGQHHFVMVTKPNEKFEKPSRVVMNDFKPSEEAFDPNKINSYPTWHFKSLSVEDNGKVIRHIAIINSETGEYYNRWGDMKSAEEFKKATELTEMGHFKDYWKAMEFYFQPEIKDGVYIWFRIPNEDNKNLVVTPMSWNTREVKLVLTK